MSSKSKDKFYTRPDIVDMCLKHINTMKYDLIVEPSAGSGAFSNKLVCDAYDLYPDKDDIIEQDYLQLTSFGSDGKVLVIGNPPFGKSARLAIEFINHSYKLGATDIAFILPKTMLRYSAQRRIEAKLSLTLSIDLPKDSFTLDGKVYDVPCVFQIWSIDSDSCLRVDKLQNIHSDIEVHIFQKQKHSYKWLDWDYDMAIARCEANPSVVIGSRVSDDRHWILVKGNVEPLIGVDWSKYQEDKMTTGLSVGDVRKAYMEAMNE